MIIFVIGYFVMGLIFLVWRLFYHLLNKNELISALRNDFADLYDYDRQIILSNPIKIKIIAVIIVAFIVLSFVPLQNETIDLFDSSLSAIIYCIMLIIYAPQENPTSKEFPVEIFGFIYSIVLMYCSAGVFVIDFLKRIALLMKICGFTATWLF